MGADAPRPLRAAHGALRAETKPTASGKTTEVDCGSKRPDENMAPAILPRFEDGDQYILYD